MSLEVTKDEEPRNCKKYKCLIFGALVLQAPKPHILAVLILHFSQRGVKTINAIQAVKIFFVSLLQHHRDPY